MAQLLGRAFKVTVERTTASAGIKQNTNEPKQSIGQQLGVWIAQFVKNINSSLQRLINATPPVVAYAAPYGFLVILGTAAALLLLQTRNQLAHISVLIGLLEKDKLLAEEKTTFIMLVSHHLRTPLTILSSSLDLIASQQMHNKNIAVAQSKVKELSQKSESVLQDVIDNEHLAGIKVPDMTSMKQKLYYSWKVIVPTVASVGVMIALNFIYITAGKAKLVVPSIFVQAAIFIVLLVFSFMLLQRRQQKQLEAAHVKKQREYEAELDKARNKFILRAAEEITPLVAEIKTACNNIKAKNTPNGIEESFTRLDAMLARFVLAAELERGKIEASRSQFNIEEVSKKVLEYQEQKAVAKQVIIKSQLVPQSIESSEFLTRYVISVLTDNAVRYAKNESSVVLSNKQHIKNSARITIKNHGNGIAPEKLEALFKPFSSLENVEVFNDQGMGLSLYLSRLIMGYLNGTITLTSVLGKQTVATVTLPLGK